MRSGQTARVDSAGLTDAELGVRIRDGDTEAMNETLRRYWSGVVEYITRHTDDLDEAKDVAQEAFLYLWQGRVVWKRVGSLKAFLFGVARNVARNRGRSWQHARVISLEQADAKLRASSDPAPDEVVGEAELLARLESAVAALPPRRQEIFTLVRMHGLSYEESAQVLGISAQTVANQMSSALAELRASIGPLLRHPAGQ
jgi:RNA polymerase sigma factor (sigma-70 family)